MTTPRQSIRNNPIHSPTLLMACRVIEALMADDIAAANTAIAPWGPGTLTRLAWSADPKDRCYIYETSADWNLFFRGIISATDFANAFIGSNRHAAPGGQGEVLDYFADEYTAMIAVVGPWLIARWDLLTVVNPAVAAFGHSRGGSLARMLLSAGEIRARVDRGASFIVEIGSPRISDTVFNRELGIQGRHFSAPDDTITQLVPRTWGVGWPSPITLVPWGTQMGTPFERLALSNRGYLEREKSEEKTSDVSALRTLWGAAALTLWPEPHYIQTYRDHFAAQSTSYGPATSLSGVGTMPVPTVMAIDDVLEFAVDGRADAQQITNVLHMRVNADPSGPGVNTTALALLRTMWKNNVLPLLNSGYSVANYTLKKISSVTAGIPTARQPHPFTLAYEWEIALPGTPADVGGVVGPALPTFVTASCRKLTGYGGRYWRGGIRFGIISEDDTLAGGNKLTDPAKALWDTASEKILRNNPPGDMPDYLTSVVFSGTYAAWGPAAPYTVIQSTADVLDRLMSARVGSLVSRRFRASGG